MDTVYFVTVETDTEVFDFAVLFLETLSDLVSGHVFKDSYGETHYIVSISIRPGDLYVQKGGRKDGETSKNDEK